MDVSRTHALKLAAVFALTLFLGTATDIVGAPTENVMEVLRQHEAGQQVLGKCEIVASVVRRTFEPPVGRIGQNQRSIYRRDGNRVQLLLAIGPPETPADWEFGNEDWERIDMTLNVVFADRATLAYQRFADSTRDQVARDPVSPWLRDGVWTFPWSEVSGPLRGFVEGDFDPLPVTLRSLKQSRTRPEVEVIGGHPCRIIEGEDAGRSYKVWFDTERGYNIVRAEVTRSWDSPFYDVKLWERLRKQDGADPHEPSPAPLDKKVSHTVTLTDVKLQSFDGVWLPVEGVSQRTIRHRTGKTTTERVHLRRDRIDLSPKFDDTAFTIDAPDGTYAADLSFRDGIEREWNNGQIEEKIDQSAADAMDRSVESVRSEGVLGTPAGDANTWRWVIGAAVLVIVAAVITFSLLRSRSRAS